MTEKVIVYRSMYEQAQDEAMFDIILPFVFDHIWWFVGAVVLAVVWYKVDDYLRDRRARRYLLRQYGRRN